MKIFRKKEGAKTLASAGSKARVGLIATLSTAIAACVACAFVAIFGGSFINNNDDWGISAPPVAEAATYTTWKAASDASAFTSGGNVVINLAANLTAVSDTTYGTTFGTAGTTYTATNNNKGYYYGALLVPTGCTVTLNLGTFTIDRALTAAKANGFVIAVYGKLTVTGTTGKIYRGYNTTTGGGVYVASGGTCYWNGGIIDTCKAQDGGGVYNAGAFRINNNSATHIQNCVATRNGGAVAANGCSENYIYQCNIHNNSAQNGGAVYSGINVQAFGISSTNCLIYSNTATKGGALYFDGDRSYHKYLDYCQIYSNTATSGGGVYVEGGVSIRYNPRIFKNTATNGGGVYVSSNGYCLLVRSETSIPYVYANTASNNGGGFWADGDLRIQGGSVGWGYKDDLSGYEARPNTAKIGGGIYASTNCYLRLEGGRIEYNTATTSGGGIYFGGTYNATGTANAQTGSTIRGKLDINSYYSGTYVRNNKVGTANNNLYMPTGKTFYIVDNLNRAGAYIGVTTQTKPTGASNTAGSVLMTAATYTTTVDAKDYFFSDYGTSYGFYTAGAGQHLYHCTGGVNANTAATGTQYDSWAEASAASAFKANARVRINLQTDLNATTGDTNYTSTFGTKNTVYDSTTDARGIYHGALLVPANCIVYLNMGEQDISRQLSAARAEGYVILVYGKLYLTGTNNQTFSIIRGGYNSGDGGAIRVENGGSVDMRGVCIRGNKSSGSGGAIHVAAGGTVSQYSGWIKENEAAANGGGVNNLGTYVLYAGEIGYRTSGFGNTAKNGGGIYNSGTLTVQGGVVCSNTATTAAGGIYQNGTMNLNTVSAELLIKNNLVGTANQNVYLPTGKLIKITNTITRGSNCLVGIYSQTAPTGASASGTKICDAYTTTYGALNLLLKSDQGKGIYQASAGAIGYHSASGGTNKADATVVTYTSWAAASAALAFKSGYTVTINMNANLTATAATGTLLSRGVRTTFNAADKSTVDGSTTTASRSSTNISTQSGYYYGSLTVPYGCTVKLNMGAYTISKGLSASGVYDNAGCIIYTRGSLEITGTAGSAKFTGAYTKGSGAIDCNEYGYLKMTNITVTGNTVRDSGGGVAVHSGYSKAEFVNCTITNNTCDLGNGGGIYSCCDTIITSCTITGNKAYNHGGGVYLNSGYDSKITGTSAAPTKIQNNSTTSSVNNNGYGGGGLAINAMRVTVDNTTISGNKSVSCGGGINLIGSGSLTMGTNVNITSNTATYGGGGVCAKRNVTMNAGTTIATNTAQYGGGVYVAAYTFTMNGGYIGGTSAAQGNTSNYNHSAGLYVASGATFTMKGGQVSYNKFSSTVNTYGGGMLSDGTVNLYGGTISYNSAKYGGGIYNKGTLNLRGGTVTANTATVQGGGIDWGAVSGRTEAINIQATQNVINVTGNTVNGAANNIYLRNGLYLTVNGSLATKAGSKMGITTQTAPGADNYTTKGIKIINAYKGSSYGNCASYFQSDKGTGFAVYCDQPTSTTATVGYHVFTYTKLTKTAWATSLTSTATYDKLTYTKAAQTATLNSTIDSTNAITFTSSSTNAALNSAKNGVTATLAGTYTLTFTPKAHYCWASESDRAAVTLTYKINQKGITVTWGSKTPTFTGAALKPTATVSAHATATNAGTYITGDTVTVSVTTHTSSTAAAANAIVPATYVAKATLGGANAANYTITSGASISDFVIGKKALAVSWTNGSQVYDGSAKLPTASATAVSTTYPATLSVAKTAGDNVNVGTYTAKATLSTASAAWYTLTGDTKTDCKVTARDISVTANGITVDAIADLTYTAAAQTPAPVVKYGTKTLVAGTDYTVAHANNTNAAAKTATTAPQVTVTGKGNYTGSIVTKFTINKAKLTLTAPTSAPKTTDNIYVGQTLADVNIVGGSAVNKTTTSVTVGGSFAWVAPTTKILKTTTTGQVQFTPTDTANYDYSDAKINVTIAPTQLKVNVSEVTKSASGTGYTVGTATAYDVDYNGTFTFATGITQTLTKPAGYSVHYYSSLDASNAPETEYLESGVAAASVKNITANTTVYVGYVAENVNYTIYYVKQQTNLSAATPAQVTNSGANLTSLLAEKVVKQAPADSRVSATGDDIKSYEGFTQTAQISTDCVSDFTNKIVNGDGSTYLIVYYQRNQYTVSWVANGGTLDTYSTKVYFECAPDTDPLGRPTRVGYGFQYWCTNNNADGNNGENQADMTAGITGNTTFYAKWGAITYNLELRPGNLEIGYNVDAEEREPGEGLGYNPLQYTIDQLPLTLKNPSAVGYVFAGWADEDGKIISKITFTTARDFVLTATWTPAKYNVRFDANGGSVRKSSMSVTNFAAYSGLDTLNPTYDGYDFVGWFTQAEGGTEINNGDPIRLKGGITLYAHWKAQEYRVSFDWYADEHLNVYDLKVSKSDDPDFDWEDTSSDGALNKGDKVIITVVPSTGYEVTELRVAGVRITNGGSYTVKSKYANNEIVVTAVLQARNYRVVYNLGGGKFVDSTEFVSSFTAEDDDVLLSENVERTGYLFTGWEYMTGENEEGEPEFDSISSISYDLIKEDSSEIDIYARWEVTFVDLIVHNNFVRAATETTPSYSDVVKTYTNTYKTEQKFNFALPVEDGFVPPDREFIGWATSPNGSVVYPVPSYNEDGSPVTTVEYTMLPEGNELYARWRLTTVQYLVMTAQNNYTYYSGSSTFAGVTLTATPRYAYSDVETKLTYQWYKITDEENVNKDEEGNYIIFDEQSHSLVDGVEAVGSPIEFYANAQTPVTLNIKNVNESGIFVCTLTAQGGTLTAGGSGNIDVSSGMGQIEAVIRPYEFDNAYFDPDDLVRTYNGTYKEVRLKFRGTSITPDREHYNFMLYDGTTVHVDYIYYKSNQYGMKGNTLPLGMVVDAGYYLIEAKFEILGTTVNGELVEGLNKGNYIIPDLISADIVINKVTINSLTFEMQQNIGGEWVRVENNDGIAQFSAAYTGNQYRIVANSNSIITADKANVEIGLSDGTTNAVGEYEAVLSGLLTGSKAVNYQIGSSIASLTRAYRITKATHAVVWELNNKNTDVYDGNAKTIALTFKDGATKLPNGVTVEYTVVYTPFNASFVAPANSIVATAAGAGGINAGTYVITASFTDEDIDNYNPIDPVTATLTVNQKDYEFSDAELRTDEELNGFGLNGTYSTNYNVDTSIKYKPELALDPNNFSVTYTYQKYNTTTNQYTDIVIGDGFRERGTYRITADVEYASDLYKNNYTDLSSNEGYAFEIDFVITPGREHSLSVEYVGDTATYKYGDSFDFANKIVVKIEYELDNKDGSHYYQIEVVNFGDYETFGENNELFEKFDRATANGDADYEIIVKYLSVSTTFTVAVEQAEFDISALDFLASEFKNNVYLVNYDANGHKPTVANAINGYGIKGILDNDIVDTTFTPVYEYALSSDKTNFAPIEGNGLVAAGEYVIRVSFTHDNLNFAAIEASDVYALLTCNARIAPKSVTSVTWQYEETAGVWKDIPESGLEYKGSAYNLRAAFAGEGDDGVITNATVTVAGAGTAVENAGAYLLTAKLSGNYSLNVTENFTLKGKAVTANWVVMVNGVEVALSDYEFEYNGTDRIDEIKVYYLDLNRSVQALTIKDKATVNFKDAGDYTISANKATDTNYDVQDIENVSVTMARKEVASVNGWQYKDASGNWIDTDGSLEYKGSAYELRAVFTGEGDDGEMYAAASCDTSIVDVNEEGYRISVGESGNYNVTISYNVAVTKKTVTVVWGYDEINAPVIYNGGQQTINATAKGVGAEVNTTIIDLSDNVQSEANTDDISTYLATASLKAGFENNYVLDNSSLVWKILPKTLTFTWDVKALTYNGSAQQIFATAVGTFGIDEVVLTYTITGDEVNANGKAVNAGAYTVEVTGINNTNYAPDTEGSQTHDFTISKATPVLTDVVYKEYEKDNTAYENLYLRNDKIDFVSKVGDAEVAGAVVFAGTEGENGIPTGNVAKESTFAWEFIPEDTKNYEKVNGSLVLEILADSMDRLDFITNNGRFFVRQRVGDKFSYKSLGVYIRYKSYYTENTVVSGVSTLVEYGKSEVIRETAFDSQLTFAITYTDEEGNSSPENAVGAILRLTGDEPNETQTITVTHLTQTDADGDYLHGEFNIVVYSTDFSVTVKDTSNCKLEYFAGETFNPVGLVLHVVYENGNETDITVTENTVGISRGNALTMSNTSARISYSGKELVIPGITVKATENLDIECENISVLLKDVGSFSLPQVTLKDGSPLPDGITASYKLMFDGKEVQSVKEAGEYTVIVSFDVKNPKYNAIADITYTVSVINKFAYTVVVNKPDDTEFVYSGNPINYQLKSYQIRDVDGNVTNDVTVSYEITRDGIKVDEVKGAGNYTITVKFGNISADYAAIPNEYYQITVDRADNTITSFTLEGWVVGDTPNTPVVVAAGGTADAQFTYSATESGTFTADVPTTAGTWFVKVYIPGTANFNAAVATQQFTIKNATTASDDGKVTIDVPDGLADGATIEKENLDNVGQYEEEGKKPIEGFDLTLKGDELEANQTVTVRLKVNEADRDKKLKVFKVEGNSLVDMDAKREGDELVFTTNDVNGARYVLMETEDGAERPPVENPPVENPPVENPPVENPPEEKPGNNDTNTDNGEGGLIAGLTIGAVVVVILVVIVIVVFVKKKRG